MRRGHLRTRRRGCAESACRKMCSQDGIFHRRAQALKSEIRASWKECREWPSDQEKKGCHHWKPWIWWWARRDSNPGPKDYEFAERRSACDKNNSKNSVLLALHWVLQTQNLDQIWTRCLR